MNCWNNQCFLKLLSRNSSLFQQFIFILCLPRPRLFLLAQSLWMASLVDGYLDLDIDGSSPIVGGPVIFLLSICLIVQCAIAVDGYKNMINNERVHRQMKILFLLCFLCSSTATATWMLFSIMSMMSYWNSILSILQIKLELLFIF